MILRRQFSRLSVCIGILLTALGACSASARLPTQTAGQPDILILIFSVPGGPDQIGLTYPGIVPHRQAMRDVKALGAATGWNISGIRITDMPPPIKKPMGKMTGIDFVVQGAVVPQSHYLPVEPFVNSLRSYRHITLTYLIGSKFGFEGLRNYADNHVKIALDQRGSTYTYQIFFHDSRFSHLKLPRYELSNAEAKLSQAPSGAGQSVTPWLVALVAAAAVGVGFIVYAIFARGA